MNRFDRPRIVEMPLYYLNLVEWILKSSFSYSDFFSFKRTYTYIRFPLIFTGRKTAENCAAIVLCIFGWGGKKERYT